MKITNKWGLPEPLVRAVSFSNYDRGESDYTVTELVGPPRIAALKRIHDDDIVEDASELLYRLLGSAGHEVLRRASSDGIVEERCTVEISGKKVSGQMDYAVPEKALIDYKFVSLWAILEGVKPEWEQQLNCYKFLGNQYGVEINDLKIIAILRDWSKAEAARKPDLPQGQVVVLPVRIWPNDVIERWIINRIKLHEEARFGLLPLCTAEEMWERPEKYAVKKKGNIRATKVLDTKDEAIRDLVTRGPGYEVEVRPAERPRCENYCSVSEFCEQFKTWKGQQK